MANFTQKLNNRFSLNSEKMHPNEPETLFLVFHSNIDDTMSDYVSETDMPETVSAATVKKLAKTARIDFDLSYYGDLEESIQQLLEQLDSGKLHWTPSE